MRPPLPDERSAAMVQRMVSRRMRRPEREETEGMVMVTPLGIQTPFPCPYSTRARFRSARLSMIWCASDSLYLLGYPTPPPMGPGPVESVSPYGMTCAGILHYPEDG